MAKKKKNSTSIPGSSKQPHKSNPSSSSLGDESLSKSPENPRGGRPMISLSFDIAEAGKVKRALEALSEPDFNPTGQGRVDIDQDGFKITVWNLNTRVVGNLRLCAKPNNNFLCRSPISPKMIDLRSLVEVFDAPRADEDVTVYVVCGSNQLSFTFASNPFYDHPVALSEVVPEYGMFPAIEPSCWALIQSQYLRSAMQLMTQEDTPQKVFVEITDETVALTVGNQEWKHNVWREWGIQPYQGDDQTVWFEWPHSNSLVHASHLQVVFCLCFESSDAPANSFMMRFHVIKKWDLSFIGLNSCVKQTCSFKFKFQPTPSLSFALESLIERRFSPENGLALIEVNPVACDITVQNYATKVTGILTLEADALIDFRCTTPMHHKKVDLKHVVVSILEAKSADYITVYHVDGSNEISFKYGEQTITTFASQLYEMEAEFEEIERIIPTAYVRISSEFLRLVVPQLNVKGREANKGKSITVCWKNEKDNLSSISIGQGKWNLEYEDKSQLSLPPLFFKWPHPPSLKLAAKVSEELFLFTLGEPSDHVMLQVDVQGLGILVYVIEASRDNPDLQD